MRRRPSLITSYLRANDPVDDGDALRKPAEARPEPGRATSLPERDVHAFPRAPRPRRGALIAASLAFVAVLVAASLPNNGPVPATLLSPQAAVAAVADDLASDGILEWREVQGYSKLKEQRRGQTGRCDCWAVVTTVADLRTGERKITTTSTQWTKSGERRETTATQWVTPNGTWLIGGRMNQPSPSAEWRLTGDVRRDPKGRIRVDRFVFGDDPAQQRKRMARDNPIDALRTTLQLARRGEAEIRDAGLDHGTPVVEIIRRKPWMTERTWITNEQTPRLVKTSIATRCPAGRPCDEPPYDGKVSWTTSVTKTEHWRIAPRNDAALAALKRPTFDRSHYAVTRMNFGRPPVRPASKRRAR